MGVMYWRVCKIYGVNQVSDKSTFFESISRLLETKLQSLCSGDKPLDLLACTQIYTTIFDTVVQVFEESKIKITNESMNYVAQQFYDGVLVNGRYELDPNIFNQRAKLENIKTKELAFIATMFMNTDFAVSVIQEIRKRS